MSAALLPWTLGGFALGSLGMAWANRRVAPAVARQRWLKLVVYALIVHAVLGACALGSAVVGALAVLIALVSAAELRRAWQRMPAPRPAPVWPVFGVAAAGFVLQAWRLPPASVAVLFVVVAAFDGFSQVCGQAVGRHRLAPTVSPNKTVEGALGGGLAALGFALALRAHWPAGAGRALALGAATAACALAGDLSAAWAKRRAGIQDYADTLPGQGGVLDRFNSFIAALAVVGLALA